MQTTGVFPTMVLQMASIGEESGSLDHMLGKAAEFYEDEVDEMVKGLSSLMEPFIIVILGTMIGGIVVAMYLPIFKLLSAAGCTMQRSTCKTATRCSGYWVRGRRGCRNWPEPGRRSNPTWPHFRSCRWPDRARAAPNVAT
jgi:hypothetical protein